MSNSSLLILQKNWTTALFDQRHNNLIEKQIMPAFKLNEAASLSIYRHSIRSQLQKVLSSIYPVCKQLVGEKHFADLSASYGNQSIFLTSDINQYGHLFSDLINQTSLQHEIPYLSDTAKFEWLWYETYHAITPHYFTEQQWQHGLNLPPEQFRLQFNPSARLFYSQYPIESIWQRYQNNNSTQIKNNLDPGKHCWLLIQKDYEVMAQTLNHEDEKLYQALLSHKSFNHLCELLVQQQLSIESALPYAVQRDWIVGISLFNNSNSQL